MSKGDAVMKKQTATSKLRAVGRVTAPANAKGGVVMQAYQNKLQGWTASSANVKHVLGASEV